jgi:hypothetical protein
MLDVYQLLDRELLFLAGGLRQRSATASQQDDCDTDCVDPIAHCAPSRAAREI